MQFSGKELAAMVKMGLVMAAADGKFAEEEKVAIALQMAQFGVSGDEATVLLAGGHQMETAEALATLAGMTTSQQKYATGFLAAVMKADGDIDDSELKVWRLVCTLCGFPTMSLGEAVEFWMNN